VISAASIANPPAVVPATETATASGLSRARSASRSLTSREVGDTAFDGAGEVAGKSRFAGSGMIKNPPPQATAYRLHVKMNLSLQNKKSSWMI
jgi:hypothetical protein